MLHEQQQRAPNAELPGDLHRVACGPILDDLAVFEAADHDPVEGHASPAMGAVKGPARGDTITLAHLLVNGTLADVLLFGGFLLWAAADRVSVGRRPAPARQMFGGKERARSKVPDMIAIVLGLALYVLFLGWAHVRLFGVAAAP